jgi:hypothetical protein
LTEFQAAVAREARTNKGWRVKPAGTVAAGLGPDPGGEGLKENGVAPASLGIGLELCCL